MVRIVEGLMVKGVNRTRAAGMLGIDYSTFYRWNRRGKAAQEEVDKHVADCEDDQHAGHWQHPDEKTERYRQFCRSVSRASALAVGDASRRVFEESPAQWLKMNPEARDTPEEPGFHGFEKQGGTTVNVGIVTVTDIMQGARETLSAAGRLPNLSDIVAIAEANDVPGLDDDLPEVIPPKPVMEE